MTNFVQAGHSHFGNVGKHHIEIISDDKVSKDSVKTAKDKLKPKHYLAIVRARI